MDKIFIILVNYKTVNHAIECIKSIKEQTYSNINIVVVDNNSKDNCKELIKNLWEDVYIIENDTNSGFSEANNIGIKYAIAHRADYLMLLNCDTKLNNPIYIERLLEFYKKESNIGIISGRVDYYYDNNVIWSAGGLLNNYKGSADIIGYKCKTEMSVYNRVTECTFVSGCCMFFSKKIIDLIGYLSDKYFLYFEDTDYCARCIKSGLRIVSVNNVSMLHKESVSTNIKSNLFSYYFTRNRFIDIKHNVDGVKQKIAYVYSFMWMIKKVLFGEFRLHGTTHGFADFCLGVTGKNERI